MIEREFYPLENAVELIGCSLDDLVYLGARGELDIYVLPGAFKVLSYYRSDEASVKTISDAPMPFKVDVESLRHLEAGKVELPIKICKKGGIYYSDFFEKMFKDESETEDIAEWLFREDKIQILAVNHIDYDQELAIKDSSFVILATDVNRLKVNQISSKLSGNHAHESYENSIPDATKLGIDSCQDYMSNELCILNKAAYEFWSTADPLDKNTHPKNNDVAGWLKKQGFSEISAKQGAVIIRPNWAAKGRR